MPQPVQASEPQERCNEDAILVFDASGSMAGTDMNTVSPHIEKVRAALRAVMPIISPVRKLGLVTYGPGPYGRCQNIELNVPPQPDAGEKILGAVGALVPAGETPLTRSVELAADVLDFRNKPATVVLLTDGEETCGGKPCELATRLKTEGKDIVVHVIGYRTPISATQGTGLLSTRCMADITGGSFLSAENTEQLTKALLQTLACPVSTRLQPGRPPASFQKEGVGYSLAQCLDVGNVVDVR